MDRSGELKQLLLPTRDDAVAAVCPPTSHSQPVREGRRDCSRLPHRVRQLDALSIPKIRDRSRSGSSVEQDNETSTTPPAPQKRDDLLIRDIQHEVGSRRAGSFDDGRHGRGPREIPDGGGPPGRIDDDAHLSQGSPKPPVPEVVLIPPTRPASPIHELPGAVPPEHARIARAHPEPSRRAPTPPEPFRPPRRGTQPTPQSSYTRHDKRYPQTLPEPLDLKPNVPLRQHGPSHPWSTATRQPSRGGIFSCFYSKAPRQVQFKFDVKSFCDHTYYIGRPYRHRAMELIKLCQLFSVASDQSFSQDTELLRYVPSCRRSVHTSL